jgi:hypothetical protein
MMPAESPAADPNVTTAPIMGGPPSVPSHPPLKGSPPPEPSPPPELNVATFQGCPVFTSGDWYNANISTAVIDPNSGNYIASMVQAGNTSGFGAPTGFEFVNLAGTATPHLKVQPKVSYHPFPQPYPWLSTFKIEPYSDAHAIIFDVAACHLYESYDTTYASDTLSAYSGANWSLGSPFVPMPAGSPSAMASGLSLFAGMVKWEEVEAGSINHALNWSTQAHTVSQYSFVRPASSTSGLPFKGSSSYQLPFGAHLRLKASFNISSFGRQARIVAQAMKTYGVFLCDTGSENDVYLANAVDGTNPWNRDDLNSLGKIHLTDFDVVTLPTIERVPGH